MTRKEVTSLRRYLQGLLRQSVRLKDRPGIEDSVEVFADDSFIGLVHRDEDGDGCYTFSVSILPEDLAEREGPAPL